MKGIAVLSVVPFLRVVRSCTNADRRSRYQSFAEAGMRDHTGIGASDMMGINSRPIEMFPSLAETACVGGYKISAVSLTHGTSCAA